jgi:hypothetical protein
MKNGRGVDAPETRRLNFRAVDGSEYPLNKLFAQGETASPFHPTSDE